MKERYRFFILMGVITVAAAIYYIVTVDHSSDLVLIGTVDANQVVVNARIAGRIEKLAVEEGTQVKQGDLIAVLDSAELTAQRAASAATIASLRSQVAQASASQSSTAGETSSAVTNAQAHLQSARAQLEEAKADMVRLKNDDERVQSLAAQGVASQQERDRSTQAVRAQQARVNALTDQIRGAEAEVKMAQARTNQAQAAQSAVASTRSQVANAEAQLAQAEARLGYTRVLAPVAGTVSVRVAREGEVVNVGEPIVTLVDFDDTWVHAAIPETYSDRIALGDTFKVRLPSGAIIEGKVFNKSAEGDFATQRDVGKRKRDIKTQVLKLRVDNSRKTLIPGMTAEVLIPQEKLKAQPPAKVSANGQ